MVQTPVGAKCPDCARHVGRTAGQAKPIYYFRAAGAGLVAAILGGFALGEIMGLVPFGSIILTFAAGMGMGEIVSQAARRNTGPRFQVIAGVSAALMFLVAGFFTDAPLLSTGGAGVFAFRLNPIRLVMAGIGIWLASARSS